MLNNVQALRALAAFLVVIHHMMALKLGMDRGPASFGRFGVDIFFVISGFIMVYTTRSGGETRSGFLNKRLIRIVPIYWIITVCLFARSILMGRPEITLERFFGSLLFVEPIPLLYVGWTLNFEMLFYVLFSIFVTVRREIVRVCVITLALSAILVTDAVIAIGNPVFQFFARPILLEFAAGMFLAILSERKEWRLGLPVGSAIMVAAFALLALFYAVGDGWGRTLVAGPLSFVIVGTAIALENNGKVIGSRTILLLGAASYSLYLTHIFVLKAVEWAAHYVFSSTIWSDVIFVTLAPFACLIAAAAIFLGMEAPLTKRLRKLSTGRRELVIRAA